MFYKLLIIVVLGFDTRCSLAETIQHCSDYLISGLYGVEDSALTSTQTHKYNLTDADFFPKNARLYSDVPPGMASGSSAAWCSNALDTNQYLQIQFPHETAINAVMIQGRGDGYGHYVKTFYLLYSVDGVTWNTVTSSDGNPKIFPGNANADDSVVRTIVTPAVVGRYIRVNPQTWNVHICFRIGLSGCHQTIGFNWFKKASVASTAELTPYSILNQIVPSFETCALVCSLKDRCLSFDFNSVWNMCIGYSVMTTTNFASHGIPYFYNTVLTDGLKYKSENDGNGLYKVNEIRQNQSSGSNICKQQYSELIKITSPSQMLFLQGVISSNTILSLDYRFFVSGQYVTKWRYDDGAEIADSSLWSVGQPEPSDGSCVMMTSTGLSSVDCSQLLFFICHH